MPTLTDPTCEPVVVSRPGRPAEEPIRQVEAVDPLAVPGWDLQVAGLEGVTFYHTAPWARVLQETYGHRPAYLVEAEAGRWTAALPVMEIRNPLSGRRGVALPFTDLCPPIGRWGFQCDEAFDSLCALGVRSGWQSVALRGGSAPSSASLPSTQYLAHRLELDSDIERLFQGLDGSVRRAVRKAQHEGVKTEISSEWPVLRTYYDLHCRTRRRFGLPPQSLRFFRAIHRHVLEPGHGFVALARYQQVPIAGAVYFHFGDHGAYKYGASNPAYQRLRGNNLVMWEAIRRLASTGFCSLDLGRTSLDNDGLRRFKTGWGARETTIGYWKFNLHRRLFVVEKDRASGWHNLVFRWLPMPLLRALGACLYRYAA